MISNWKLNTESSCEEPRLRRLLGHISVYDKTHAIIKEDLPSPTQCSESQDVSTNFGQQEIPSFKEFQAAIEVQLATLAALTATSVQCREVDEYDSEDDEDDDDDSDYYSNDGDGWSDDGSTTVSDESLTDNEGVEEPQSECTSPTYYDAKDKDQEEDDLWAMRPAAPFFNSRVARLW